MKSTFTYNQRSAIATAAVVGIVVVIIAIIGVGAYVALSQGGKTSTTTTSSSSSITTTTSSVTTSTTSQGTVSTSTSTGSTSTVSTSTSLSISVTGSQSVSFDIPTSLPSVTISETGSSLLYPLFNLWVSNFTSKYSNVKLTPASTGSGTGQSSVEKGIVQIGSSDAYLTNAQASANPNILNIPLAISAQQINYNVPGIASNIHLNFSGPVLAGIYNGSITYWDDASIKAMQSASVASMLPHHTIIPIHRSDGSGDTFIFTQYLSFSSPSWNSSKGGPGFGTAITWPNVPGEQSANGNGGMVTLCNSTQYSIAYIGISYLDEASVTNHTPLGYAYLKNHDGNFVNISTTNIQAAANQLVSTTPADERISLVFASGANSYPIINYEYAMVSKVQNTTGMATALKGFYNWALDPQYGSSMYFLGQVSFVPLPTSVIVLSLAQVNQITGP